MSRTRRGSGDETSPGELPQGTPRDLYATSDIRLVMVELGKQGTRLDILERAIEKLGQSIEKAVERLEGALDKQTLAIKDDVKAVKSDVDTIKADVSYAKGAVKALSIIGPLLILVLSAIAAALARKWIG